MRHRDVGDRRLVAAFVDGEVHLHGELPFERSPGQTDGHSDDARERGDRVRQNESVSLVGSPIQIEVERASDELRCVPVGKGEIRARDVIGLTLHLLYSLTEITCSYKSKPKLVSSGSPATIL